MSYRPLFIFGLARSGTNLLARMLDGHPQVAVGLDPLLPLFSGLRNALIAAHAPGPVRQGFSPAAPFQDYYFHPDGPALLDTILCATTADLPVAAGARANLRKRIVDRAALESPTLGAAMAKLDGATYSALLAQGINIVAQTKPGASWAGSKEVWVLEFVPLLASIFPDARFYAVERDPRAIVASLLAMAAMDPTQAAHAPSYMRHWRKQVALTRRFEKTPELAGRFRAVSYELLATEPERGARELCVELGLSFSPQMLGLSAAGWLGNSSYGQQGGDVYLTSMERWRQTLPRRVVEAVDFHCGPEMALTPYRPASEPVPAGVLGYIEESGRVPGSWRSDSSDALADFGGELVRHAMLADGGVADGPLARRCFLFADTFDAIRRAAK